MRFFIISILCISFSLGSIGLAWADKSAKKCNLIFVTFDDKSAKTYAYLRDSIQTMLMSRLAANDNIEVIDRALDKKELALLTQKSFEGKKKPGDGVEYLVTGGIYALAKGINVQITMYPFDSTLEVLHFARISEKSSDIIANNDEIIASILTELFGESAVEGANSAMVNGSTSGFTTEHPEAEYKKELYSGTIVESELHGVEVKASGIKRTLSVTGEIIAFTVGDLDGNGIEEIVSLTSSTLDIYQTQDRSIIKIAEMKLPPTFRGHALNLGDFNKDGYLEIYISATQGLRVASRIIGWSEVGGFTTLAKDVTWYLRPIQSDAMGLQLAGQKRGREKIDFVGKGVFILDLDKNFKISEKSRLPLPEGVNLFDFSYAELDGEKGEELVVLDSSEKLHVISSNNELLWVSSDTYGGSKTYIGPSQGAAVDKQSRTSLNVNEDADRELVFVPARILVTDVDNDGLAEIVVNKNKSGALGFFKKLRSYDNGTVVGLAWNGSELTEAWRTGRYKGHVADYFFQKTAIVPAEHAVMGRKHTAKGRLYVANMPHSGSMMGLLPGVSDTKLTIYELDFYKQKQSDKK